MTDALGPLAEYRRRLTKGRFSLQHCEACGRAVFYPRLFCPHCHSQRLVWRDATGTGEVYAVTVIARSPAKGGSYNVVIVELDEGVRMMSRVDGVAPESVAIGDRVRVVIVEEDGEPLIVFRREGRGAE